MMLILSGEGPTDLGACVNAQGMCQPNDYRSGPMAILVDLIIEQKLGYRVLDSTPDCVWFVSESMLAQRAKAKSRRSISLRGSKGPAVETGYFYRNAMMLAEIAKELEERWCDTSVAVLFRDADGTHSSIKTAWQDKFNSICSGFTRSDYPFGVAMLPKPKSEACLLGLVQKPAPVNCAGLEDLSGNDASPNSAKGKLAQVLGQRYTAADLCEWIEQCSKDMLHLQHIPSFACFYQQLDAALTACRRSTTFPHRGKE